ncbi:MAG: hypothetical protein LBM93_14890 [Oscillospiraceae bacterium]|jgi:hypothetical protein|nr:hypothetical protein [Oscillospiraceae bacterium]
MDNDFIKDKNSEGDVKPLPLEDFTFESSTVQPLPLEDFTFETTTVQPLPLEDITFETTTVQPLPLEDFTFESSTVQPLPLEDFILDTATVQSSPSEDNISSTDTYPSIPAQEDTPIPGLVMYNPFADNSEDIPLEENPQPKVYDDNLDFSLDEPVIAVPPKQPVVQSTETDNRFDDIEEISFDEIKIENTQKKSLDDIDVPVFDDIKTETKQAATLDDVEDVQFTEAEYTVEKKTLDDIETPDLAVEETPKTDYAPKFVDPSLEEAKKSAKANANKAALSSNNVDPKKALASMREFQREKEREMAKKGFKLVFVFLFLGFIACASLYLFSTEIIFGFKEDATFSNKIRPLVPYGCGITAVFTFLLIVPSKGLKGFTSFLYFLMFILSIVCTFMLMGKDGNFFVNLAMVVVPAILFLINLIVLSSNDNIEMFYKRKDED